MYILMSTQSSTRVKCYMLFTTTILKYFSTVLVDYAIYQDTNPAFDFDTKSNYELDVECIDDHGGVTGTSLTKTLYVYLLKNQPPVITNLQG